MTDGTSSTILAGSIDAAFPAWGDPQNGRDPTNGFAGGPHSFGGGPVGAYMLMIDGSVRTFGSKTDISVAAALASPSAGDEVPREF
ncbi:MAG: hypothetical protein M3552_08260 [Planctomycetota bacterium]|nr:hypothetical protein [Planctomycetota bacterium]